MKLQKDSGAIATKPRNYYRVTQQRPGVERSIKVNEIEAACLQAFLKASRCAHHSGNSVLQTCFRFRIGVYLLSDRVAQAAQFSNEWRLARRWSALRAWFGNA